MWLKCVGGPLDGKDFLPGDDVPEGGEVTLTVRQKWYEFRRGYYVRTGSILEWEYQ